MPLVTCPDCNKQVSDTATACIHCGRPMIGGASTEDAVGLESTTQAPCVKCSRPLTYLGIKRKPSAIGRVGLAFFGSIFVLLAYNRAHWYLLVVTGTLALGSYFASTSRERDRFKLYKCPSCRSSRQVPL